VQLGKGVRITNYGFVLRTRKRYLRPDRMVVTDCWSYIFPHNDVPLRIPRPQTVLDRLLCLASAITTKMWTCCHNEKNTRKKLCKHIYAFCCPQYECTCIYILFIFTSIEHLLPILRSIAVVLFGTYCSSCTCQFRCVMVWLLIRDDLLFNFKGQFSSF
jgi:hypothetical protein